MGNVWIKTVGIHNRRPGIEWSTIDAQIAHWFPVVYSRFIPGHLFSGLSWRGLAVREVFLEDASRAFFGGEAGLWVRLRRAAARRRCGFGARLQASLLGGLEGRGGGGRVEKRCDCLNHFESGAWLRGWLRAGAVSQRPPGSPSVGAGGGSRKVCGLAFWPDATRAQPGVDASALRSAAARPRMDAGRAVGVRGRIWERSDADSFGLGDCVSLLFQSFFAPGFFSKKEGEECCGAPRRWLLAAQR